MNVLVKNISGFFPKSLFIMLLAMMPFMVSAQGNGNLVDSENWTLYKEYGAISVEYKFSEGHSGRYSNEKLLLFRYTNNSNKNMALKFQTEIHRDGECSNCHNLDTEEYLYDVKLSPNEVLEGSGLSKDNKALYIFGNFVTLYPGMTEQYLTDFKFINVESYIWK
jgi:hypothetical protein